MDSLYFKESLHFLWFISKPCNEKRLVIRQLMSKPMLSFVLDHYLLSLANYFLSLATLFKLTLRYFTA